MRRNPNRQAERRAAGRANPPAAAVASRAPWTAATWARVALGLFAAVMAWLVLVAHRVPLYGVETDLFGEYIPAARALLAGHVDAGAYEFKGPGYPLLLALASLFTAGDGWLAARLLNLGMAVAAAWFTFRLVRRAAGDAAALFVLVALCANPLFVRSTIEAGTDVPTFALSLAATHFALSGRGARGAALAGFLAGVAILCRYSAAFLVPAGVLALVLSRERSESAGRCVAAYALGLAAPLVPWLVVNQRLTGSAFANRNYLNVAYEFYGGGMGWDQFWAEAAPRFHSLGDVVRFDPRGVLLHWLRNVGTRWIDDARQLVPLWLGVAAIVGGLLHARRATRRAGLVAHAALAYLSLSLVFYAPRFFLYLVPFYLVGAALAFFPRGGAPRRLGRWPAVAAAVAIVASGVLAARETAALLRDPPREVLSAGAALRPLARPGDRVIARKPQVAYFAGMAYEPLPRVETLRELLVAARAAHADYLALTGIEIALRPQFRLLAETDATLPGFTPLARDVADPAHFFVLYRIEPPGPADARFDDALVAALLDLGARAADRPEVQSYVGAMLLDEGRTADALAHLGRALALAPGAVQPRVFRAAALLDAGEVDAAGADCALAIASLAQPPAALHLLMGYIRVRQDRWDEAQASFDAATRVEPANAAAWLALGATRAARGDGPGGVAALDRAIQLVPRLAPARPVVTERAARGDRAGLARLLDLVRRTQAAQLSVESLVDSLQAGRG